MTAKLVERARNGDADAYTELVRRFQDAVFATAHQTVLDFDVAFNVAQETFVRACQALGTLRDPARFAARNLVGFRTSTVPRGTDAP